MKSNNSIRDTINISNKKFKTLVEELKDSKRRVDSKNHKLRNKLGVESKSNEEILRRTKELCNSILKNEGG